MEEVAVPQAYLGYSCQKPLEEGVEEPPWGCNLAGPVGAVEEGQHHLALAGAVAMAACCWEGVVQLAMVTLML